jgi:quinol-cytochrome oxidoreductase complex cytochrome b subunit
MILSISLDIVFFFVWILSLRADKAPWTILSGVFLTFIAIFQSSLGVLLLLHYTFDPFFIPLLNEDFVIDSIYFGEFAIWHSRFVELLFFFSYIHFFRKLYIKAYSGDISSSTWSLGVYIFLIFHYIAFLGIVLTGTQIGELTILIGANICHSLSYYTFDFYVWLFGTSKTPTSDILVRFGILHFVLGIYIIHLVLLHLFLQHEKYGCGESFPAGRVDTLIPFFPETMTFEINVFIIFILYVWSYSNIVTQFGCYLPETHYVSLRPMVYVWTINYYIVCPHWYFIPYMGFLVACAQHFEAMFLLGLYVFLLLFYLIFKVIY